MHIFRYNPKHNTDILSRMGRAYITRFSYYNNRRRYKYFGYQRILFPLIQRYRWLFIPLFCIINPFTILIYITCIFDWTCPDDRSD